MGIKMEAALDSAGEEWLAADYEKGMGREPLRCTHCPASVTHNSSYARERDDKSILVPAYFRLLPGRRHLARCQYSVQDKVENIARKSIDLFEHIGEGKYRLRLVMIRRALEGGTSKLLRSKSGNNEKRVGRSFMGSYDKLLAYINSAMRVLQLRALCDGDDEISENLELVFEGNTIIHWSQFYFETERHSEAFAAILRSIIQHPIALHGTVKSKRLGVGREGKGNVINLQRYRYQASENDAANGVGVEASVWSRDADWLSSINEGDEVVILGVYKATRGEPTPSEVEGRFKTFTTNKIGLNLLLPTQIAKVPVR